MLIKVKRFDKSLPLPSYQSAGAAGFDVYCRTDTKIAPKSVGYIPLKIALEIPAGYWVLLAARSSTHKKGLLPANGIGIGDWDFCGDEDEYLFACYNYLDQEVVVERGTRIAQMLVLPYEKAQIKEVEKLTSPSRGGFGSTGHK
jgi:dUTP pyrophosphatase